MSRLKLPKYSMPHDLKEVLEKNLEVYPGTSKKSQTFLEILKALKKVDRVDLSEDHYLQLSKLALYLEEYQIDVDNVKKYTLLKKSISKRDVVNSEFQVSVEFVVEDKPSIKRDDFATVIDTTDKTSYALRVTNVSQTHIVLRDDSAGFSKTYAAGKVYNIQFQVQIKDHDYPRRCAHFALGLIHNRNTLTYLFPFKSKPFVKGVANNTQNFTDFKAINPAINANPEQIQAVLSIINKTSFPAPYVLYGPPGTGKTATLVEAICQLYRDFPGSRILVATPSNNAADEITRRLLKFIGPQYIYRIYSQSRDGSKIDEEIKKCSNFVEDSVVYAKYEDIMQKKIVISTICNSMRLVLMKIPKDHFSHLMIDEACHGIEPDILIPISLISGDGRLHGQIVLAGDPQQLGPTVNSKIAATILCCSILERLMSYDTYQKDSNNKYNPNYITKLLQNYRNHPDILRLPNKLFYDNELIPMAYSSGVNGKFPVIFHGVEGKEEKVDFSFSSCNPKETQLVIKYIDYLLKNKFPIGQVSAEDIAVITPFALQSKLIKKLLKDKNIKGIKVASVDAFQGQERKIIIITTVRSETFIHNGLEHLGSLSSSNRFNTSLTRAKQLCIIVGNPNVLQKDDNWRNLMKFCSENKSYLGLQLPATQLSDDGTSLPKTLKIVASTSLFGKELPELFTLHELEECLYFSKYEDDYDDLIDIMEDWNMFDDIYDDYNEDEDIAIIDDWNFDDDDDPYDFDLDFVEPEDDNEVFYDDPPDLSGYDYYDELYSDNLEECGYDDYHDELFSGELESFHIDNAYDYY